MKKLLACGLVLSTLVSFGSACFAAGLDHEEPDLCYTASKYPGYRWRPCDCGVTLYQEQNYSTLVLRDVDGIYNIFSLCDNDISWFNSAGGYSKPIVFNYDTKGNEIINIEFFLNYGDGSWVKCYDYVPNWGDSQNFEVMCHTKCQYKIKMTFQDGSSETIKFLGQELMENMYGELDFGVVCFRHIRPVLSSAFEPVNSESFSVECSDMECCDMDVDCSSDSSSPLSVFAPTNSDSYSVEYYAHGLM